jgi:hypothetical protein
VQAMLACARPHPRITHQQLQQQQQQQGALHTEVAVPVGAAGAPVEQQVVQGLAAVGVGVDTVVVVAVAVVAATGAVAPAAAAAAAAGSQPPVRCYSMVAV